MPLQKSSMSQLLDRYDAFFFDAYGVFVNESYLLPGAVELMQTLKEQDKPFWIITNGSSRLPEHTLNRYQNLGLPLTLEQIISSGMMLQPYFEMEQLQGSRVAVMGPKDAFTMVERAGGVAVDPAETADYEILVVANQTPYPFLPTVNQVISQLLQAEPWPQALHHEQKTDKDWLASLSPLGGRLVVVTNPDLIYPRGDNGYSITAGMVGMMLEQAVQCRYGKQIPHRFVKLGKPAGYPFKEGLRRAGNQRVLMIGDQMMTDIRGAKDAGIDSALIMTGVSVLPQEGESTVTPNYILDNLHLDEAGLN